MTVHKMFAVLWLCSGTHIVLCCPHRNEQLYSLWLKAAPPSGGPAPGGPQPPAWGEVSERHACVVGGGLFPTSMPMLSAL